MIKFTLLLLFVATSCFATSPPLTDSGFIDSIVGLLNPQAVYDCGDLNLVCLPYFLCIDGEFEFVPGEGLIDIRTQTIVTAQCTNHGPPNVPALCCKKHGRSIFPNSCPGDGDLCVEYSQCGAQGYIVTDNSGIGNPNRPYTKCQYYHAEGICCAKVPPHYKTCPTSSYCAKDYECTGKVLSAKNVFIDFQSDGKLSTCDISRTQIGICCEGEILPPLKTCSLLNECVLPLQCSSTGKIITDGSGILNPRLGQEPCSTPEGDIGVCCRPARTPYVEVCPPGAQCVIGSCKGNALDEAGIFVTYDPNLLWTACNAGHQDGICCKDLPPVSSCGLSNTEVPGLDKRILGPPLHNEAKFGEFPWQAIIFYQNYTFICGATLLTEKYVLTAAHCVHHIQPGDMRLRLGEYQVNSFEELYPYQDKNVVNKYVHETFLSANLQENIAVLELESPVTYDYHINRVCLPGPNTIYKDKKRCFVSGWGKDSFEGTFQHKLKKIDVPLVKNNRCQKLLRKTRLGWHFQLDHSFICAGGEENKDACYGDVGGPLVCLDNGQYYIYGITIWEFGCEAKNVPGMYTNVKQLVPWINSIINPF